MNLSANFLRGGLCSLGLLVCLTATSAQAENEIKLLASGLVNPESAIVGPDGRIYVSVIGERDTDGDGTVAVIVDGKPQIFATGLYDPKGLALHKGILYVADRQKVWRVPAAGGKAEVFADTGAFPIPPLFLNDLAVDEQGTFYVTDSGDRKGEGGALFKITPEGKVSLVLSAKKSPEIKMPNGVLPDGPEHVLMADFLTGTLYRVKLSDGSLTKVAEGLGAADGIVRDAKNNLYISDYKGGRVYQLPAGAHASPKLIAKDFQNSADICLDASGKLLLVPDMKAGTLSSLAIGP